MINDEKIMIKKFSIYPMIPRKAHIAIEHIDKGNLIII